MTLATQTFSERRPKYWTKEQYRRLEDIPRALGEPRFFLLRGEIIEMPPLNQPHVWALRKCTRWAVGTFEPTHVVREQAPIDVPGDSMPQPDLAIVSHEEDAKATHPSSALMVIEVSDSTLYEDRKLAPEYASANVATYWILDIKRRVLEVRTQIIDDPQSPTGKDYANLRTLTEEEVAETFDPSISVQLKELLP